METGNPTIRPGEPAESRFHRGTNQSGMRDANERVVLSLVRRHGSLAKTDIARMTGTFGADRLGDHARAGEGRPVHPPGAGARQDRPAVDPDGAQSRRRLFPGPEDRPPQRRAGPHRFPRQGSGIQADVLQVSGAARDRRIRHRRACRSSRRPRPPPRTSGLPASASRCRSNSGTGPIRRARRARSWMHGAIATSAPKSRPNAVFPSTCRMTPPRPAAPNWCSDKPARCRDFIYFYIGAFAGGGVVLNGSLYSGQSGNAGALGSMPVPGPAGKPTQLIDVASIAILEQALNAKGRDVFAAVVVPGRLGRPRRGAGRLDRRRSLRPRLRHRLGLFGHRFRGRHHRRLDAGVGAASGWSPPPRRRSARSMSKACTFPRCAKAPSAFTRARSAAPACRFRNGS